jgi:hypothetical protein
VGGQDAVRNEEKSTVWTQFYSILHDRACWFANGSGDRAARKADCILEDATTHVVSHCPCVHVCVNSRPGCVIHYHLTARASKG